MSATTSNSNRKVIIRRRIAARSDDPINAIRHLPARRHRGRRVA
jgi:hypothetical protein